MTALRHRFPSPLLLSLLLLAFATTSATHAQEQASTAGAPREATQAARPWSSLTPEQRELLAPLRADWDTLPPRKQSHMLDKAKHWATLPPDERAKIRERIARWHAMTPEQRHLARENMRKFHQLPPEQRAQLHDAYQHFQQLPPEQRERLLRQWHSQTIEQRQQWLRHDRGRDGEGDRHPPPPNGR